MRKPWRFLSAARASGPRVVPVRLLVPAAILLLVPGLAFGQFVDIPDAALRERIHVALGSPDRGAPVTFAQMASLTSLDAEESGITDLTGLQEAVNLIELDLEDNAVADLAPLSDLRRLEALDLDDNPLDDLAPLGEIASLRVLSLGPPRGSDDLAPVGRLTQLESLSVSTELASIAPLANLTNLRSLSIRTTPAVVLAELAGFNRLESLSVAGITVEPTSALWQMPGLRTLSLRHPSPAAGALSVLAFIPPYIESLDLEECGIADLSALAAFDDLRSLNLRRNAVSDLSPLSGLRRLETLSLDGNRVSDLSPLENVESLHTLLLANNPVRSLEPLRHLEALRVLRLWDAPIATLDPIADLPSLVSVSTTGTFLDLREGSPDSGIVDALRNRGAEVATGSQQDVLPVAFADARLERVVRLALGRSEDDDPITTLDLAGLAVLVAQESGITDITPLQHAANLSRLDVAENPIADLTPISGLRNLAELNIEESGGVADTTILARLTWLRVARLGAVNDLSGLQNLHRIEVLTAWGGSLRDLSPLRNLRWLRVLDISDSAVADLEPLRPLTRLESLEAANTNIAFLNPLREHRHLRVLRVGDCRIQSLAPISGFGALDEIDASGNLITDLTPLDGITIHGLVQVQDNHADIGAGSASRDTMERLRARAPLGPDWVRFEPQQPPLEAPPRLEIARPAPGAITLRWPARPAQGWIVFASPDLERWSAQGFVPPLAPGGIHEFAEEAPDPRPGARYFLVAPARAE